MKEPVYEVFARKTREEPMRHIGWINAMDDDLARVYAWKTYDEQNWAEMCVIPRSAIIPLDPTESQFVTAANAKAGAERIVRMSGTGSYGGGDVAVNKEAR
ncbi:MAG: phenylacetic acid degradation b [Gemmatimonadota bacterium]|nr:phenylacetic acid degradation b [Gemmatimonadota bacterium]